MVGFFILELHTLNIIFGSGYSFVQFKMSDYTECLNCSLVMVGLWISYSLFLGRQMFFDLFR